MSPTKWIPLESGQLDAVAMHQGELLVRFRDGSMYAYTGVDQEDILGLLFPEEGSHGKAFHKLIKVGGYEYQKISEEDIEAIS